MCKLLGRAAAHCTGQQRPGPLPSPKKRERKSVLIQAQCVLEYNLNKTAGKPKNKSARKEISLCCVLSAETSHLGAGKPLFVSHFGSISSFPFTHRTELHCLLPPRPSSLLQTHQSRGPRQREHAVDQEDPLIERFFKSWL